MKIGNQEKRRLKSEFLEVPPSSSAKGMHMNTIKLTQIITILFTLAVAKMASAETHVFWYKALQNNYALSDSPGPNIPANAIVHEGKIATCNNSIGLGYSSSGFACGSNISDDQGWSSCLYSANLNDPSFVGTVDSAFIRGEYADWTPSSSPLCNGGPINIRCGVVDVTFGVDTLWLGGENLPDDAVWPDLAPWGVLSYSLALVDSTIDTLAFIAESGRRYNDDPSVLDSHFVRVNVTKQVQWIVQHHNGEYGIALLSPVGQGSVGNFYLRANENCIPDPPRIYVTVPNHPWSKDDNTVHLLVYGDLTDSVRSERPSTTVGQACVVSICPNPFNPSTMISYAIPGNGQTELAIFSLAGKLIYRKQVSGKGSYAWDASGQPSGVYVCRINAGEAGSKVISRRMILIR